MLHNLNIKTLLYRHNQQDMPHPVLLFPLLRMLKILTIGQPHSDPTVQAPLSVTSAYAHADDYAYADADADADSILKALTDSELRLTNEHILPS